MIKNHMFSVDLIRPYILWTHGGLYIDTDFHYHSSPTLMHKTFDLYTGLELPNWTGLGAGVVGVRPKHPAMKTWKDVILEYWGYRPSKYGSLDFMPMPCFFQDCFGTAGPRAFSFAIWYNLGKHGNSDAIFKESIINFDVKNDAYLRAVAGEWTYKFRDWEPAKKLYLENPTPLEETLKFDNGE